MRTTPITATTIATAVAAVVAIRLEQQSELTALVIVGPRVNSEVKVAIAKVNHS